MRSLPALHAGWLLAAAFGCAQNGLNEASARLGVEGASKNSAGRYIVDFGTVVIGQIATKTITAADLGTPPLTLQPPSVMPPFSTDERGTIVIRGGDRTDLHFTFAPTSMGQADQVIVLQSTAGNATLELRGTGTVAPSCVFLVSPSQVDFGTIFVGQTRSSAVQFANLGDGNCTVSDIQLDPSSDPSFALAAGQATSATVSATAGSFPITLTFAPTQAAAQVTGNLTLTVGPPATRVTVPLSGVAQAVPCTPGLQPMQLNFDVVPGQDVTQTVQVLSMTSTPCAITGVEIETGSDPSFTLAAGQPTSGTSTTSSSFPIAVTFAAASAATTVTGHVLLTAGPPAVQLEIPLIGKVGPCTPGQAMCGSSCVNTYNDPNNCGSCANGCAAGDLCSSGICVGTCGTETDCSGFCVQTDTDPNNCGSCGTKCATGQACSAGQCVSIAVASACLPTSALTVLVQGSNVTAYVPNGSWYSFGTGVQVVPLEGAGVRATIATPGVVNSCSSNSLTGTTVCTANNADVYVIQGSSLVTTLTSATDSFLSFTGGECNNCGVIMDAFANTAWVALGLNSFGAFQPLNLASNTLGTPISSNNTRVSEDIMGDSARKLLLSPTEAGDFQLVRTDTGVVYDNNLESIIPSSQFDSAGEDCTTGIALGAPELSGYIWLADLTQAVFTDPTMPGTNGTWTAPSNPQLFPEFMSLPAGVCAAVVAPGSHLAIVAGELGGNIFGVARMPSTSGAGIPAITDYVVASVPPDPSGTGWVMGAEPHSTTAYVSPSSGRAFGFLVNNTFNPATYAALIDLNAVLAAPRMPGTHTVDGTYDLAAHGVITFVSVH
jgi:hypothetical protein